MVTAVTTACNTKKATGAERTRIFVMMLLLEQQQHAMACGAKG